MVAGHHGRALPQLRLPLLSQVRAPPRDSAVPQAVAPTTSGGVALLPFADVAASLPSGRTAPLPPGRASCCWRPDPCCQCRLASDLRRRTASRPHRPTPTSSSPCQCAPWPASAHNGRVAGVLSHITYDILPLRTPPSLRATSALSSVGPAPTWSWQPLLQQAFPTWSLAGGVLLCPCGCCLPSPETPRTAFLSFKALPAPASYPLPGPT
jgi:hypothetical protein